MLIGLLRDQPPSIEEALRRIAGRRALRRARARCRDWRLLPAILGDLLGTSEETVMRQAALAMDVPYLQRVSALPRGTAARGVDLRGFRTAGAIGLGSPTGMTGIVCVDPRRTRRLPFAPGLPLFVSTWSSISQALDRSEGTPSEMEVPVETAERTIALLISTMQKHGARQLEIDTGLIPPQYRFQAADGRCATGTIHAPEPLIGRLRHDAESAVPVTLCEPEAVYTAREESEGTIILDLLSSIRSSVVPPLTVDRADPVPLPPRPLRTAPSEEVLIIEDQPVFAAVVKRYLEREGWTVRSASCPREALKSLLCGTTPVPRALICDLHLPSMSAEELLHHLRRDSALSDTPVLVLSADDSEEAEVRLITAGADAFVLKNRDPRLLLAHLGRLCRSGGRERAA